MLVGLIAWGMLMAYFAVRIGLNSPTRAAGDEPDYDTIAWELSRGRGYRLNYPDPEFRRPYDEAARRSDLYQLHSQRVGVTTYRPPLFPIAVAAGNRLFGRQFWWVRAWNSAALAAGCGLLAALVGRWFGWRTAIASAGLFVLVDARTRLYAGALLTEAMAALLAGLLLVWFAERTHGARWQSCLAGILTGLAILTRSMFVFWLPWLCASLVLALRKTEKPAGWRRVGVHLAIYLSTVALVVSPWSIWCSRVLGQFSPLGAQGAVELPAGWSDAAWSLRGEWRSPQPAGYFEFDHPAGLSIAEREALAAREGMASTRQWIAAHPLRALALVPIKIAREFQPRTWSQAVILLLAIAGAANWRRLTGGHPAAQGLWQVALLTVAAQALAIGLTWTVPEGRFVVPLLVIEHLFAAAGLATISGLLSGVQGSRHSSERATRKPVSLL